MIITDNTVQGRNAAIKIPNKVTTDDGRELKITRWAPIADVNDRVRVTIEAVISLPESYWEAQS